MTLVWGVGLALSAWTARAQQSALTPFERSVIVRFDPVVLPVAGGGQLRVTDLPAHWQPVAEAFGTFSLQPRFTGNQVSRNRAVDFTPVYTLTFHTAPADVRKVCRTLQRFAEVVYAEPWYAPRPFYDPNDPQFTAQTALSIVKAAQAWDLNKGDSSLAIYIVDTGIDWAHEDLEPNLRLNTADPIDGIDNDGDGYVDNYRGWDFLGPSANNPQPDNDTRNPVTASNHGTHVTGIAAARTDNGLGIAGAGFRTRFVPVKACSDSSAILFAAYDGIKYAADKGATVVNCSFGDQFRSQFQQEVVNYATDQGTLVVAAGGNTVGEFTFYPGGYDNVLSVAATNNQDRVVTSYNPTIDLGCPGFVTTTLDNNQYFTSSGSFTSYAAPIVSGAAALVKAHNPVFTPNQIAEQLRITCDPNLAVHDSATFIGKIGSGRLNMFRALNEVQSSIRLQQLNVSDGNDNTPVPGETIQLRGGFKNWLKPTANLQVKLVVSDPFVTQGNATAGLGAVTTFQTKFNTNQPFVLTLASDCPPNYRVLLKFEYTDGSAYSDVEYQTLLLNPTFINLTVPQVQTSISANGEWGFNNAPFNPPLGLGLAVGGKNYLYEGGLCIANAPTRVRSNYRNASGQQSADFTPRATALRRNPGLLATEEGVAQFNDSLTADGLRVNVRLETYGNATDPNNTFVIFRYVFQNPNLFAVSGLRTGLMADLDFGTNASNDSAAYAPTLRMVYAWGDEEAPASAYPYIGIVALTANNQTVQVRNGRPLTLSFADTAKYNTFSSGVLGTAVQNADVILNIGQGPFAVAPNDTASVAFAFVYGTSVAQLQERALQAKARFACLFVGSALRVALGNDTASCEPVVLNGATAGAVSYLWNTSATTPVLTASQSGTYSLTAFDANGCASADQITVTIVPRPVVEFSLSDTVFRIGRDSALTFTNRTQGSREATWFFGDGFGSFEDTVSYTYRSEGLYTVTLIVSNGLCSDSLKRTVRVERVTARQLEQTPVFGLGPNPLAGSELYVRYTGTEPVARLELSTLTGQTVRSLDLPDLVPDQTYTCDVSGLPAGVYLARLVGRCECYLDSQRLVRITP
jgi:subtilisin family serine protease